MKILYTVSTYKPHMDGIQFVTSYLAEGLAARGHTVDLIAYEYPELTDKKEEMINGVHVMRFAAKTVHMQHKGDPEAYRNFILTHQDEYDVMINVGSQTAFTDWLLPIMDQIRIPKVLHLHSVWEFTLHKHDLASLRYLAAKLLGNLRWGWYFLRYRKAFHQYDAVLQLHEQDYGYRFFKKIYGIDSVVLENAVEAPFFEIDGVQKEKTILNVSNYCTRKNQLQCVKVFANSKLPDDWKLVLVGSRNNAYYQQLKRYCETELDPAKRERVVLHVGVPRAQIPEMVKASSIYMMTSQWEAFPISILEAMAAGVPYISTDVGIVKYLGGGHVSRKPEELSRHLERLAADGEYRAALGREGRQEALEKYQICKKVDQLEQLLQRLASKGQKE